MTARVTATFFDRKVDGRYHPTRMMRFMRVCFLCGASWVALYHAWGGSANAARPLWHCDLPVLAPDGVHVAYLQWDSRLVRIAVVNLDQPGRTMYFNLGENWTEPISILWKTKELVELRKGTSTFAHFTVDAFDDSPPGAPGQSRGGSFPPVDQTAFQLLMQHKLPHRSIRILNWDEESRRVLLLADAANDAGRFFVYDRSSDLLFEMARRKKCTEIQ